MTDAEIAARIGGIVNGMLNTDVDLVTSDVSFFDLGLDSILIVDFLVEIEMEFSISISEEKLKEDHFLHSKKMIELVKEYL